MHTTSPSLTKYMSERTISTPQEWTDLKLECAKQVKFYVDLANRKLNLSMPYPWVEFGLKGTTAGRAWYRGKYEKPKIQFQPTLLLENPETFLTQTAGHEVAHLAAHFRHANKEIDPHGMEWRSVMWTLGLPANRCHNYDTSNVSTRSTSIRRPVNRDKTINPHGRLVEWD